MVIGEYLTQCSNRIGQRNAELIFLSVFETNTLNLFMQRNKELSDSTKAIIEPLIERAKNGEPIQYILGETEFMGLPFKVEPGVLIPRPDTENLVEEILACAKQGSKILDICTGSGCIGISLAKLLTNSSVTCLDISDTAITIAQQNARLNNISINIKKADILSYKIQNKYDIIVSNPPYIRADVISTLDVNVRDYEPHLALDGGDDGLKFYRKISSIAKSALNPDGALFFEIGFDQGQSVLEILKNEGYKNVELKKDYAGNDRVVKAFI